MAFSWLLGFWDKQMSDKDQKRARKNGCDMLKA